AVGLLTLRNFAPSAADDPRLTGDGKTDDTAALRTLLRQKGALHLPRGVYRITESIVIDLDTLGPVAVTSDGTATLRMDGPGPVCGFVGTHQGTADPKSFKPKVLDRQRTPMVVGLEITGGHADADAIEAEGTMQLTLERVVVRNCRHAVHLVKRNRNLLISA